jgi:hypothetical protein
MSNLSTGENSLVKDNITLVDYIKVGPGNMSPLASADLSLAAKPIFLPVMSTTQILAINGPSEGFICYNSTIHKLVIRTAANWEIVGSDLILAAE